MATLADELTALKTEEDKITGNKVANFSYDDYAYEHNDANGVDTYNVDNHQNIPNGTASILKVNATILTKGWRAQASAITRMLMNHFLGRCSYNLNKVNDHFSALLAKLIAYLGSANGIATLGSDGYVPTGQLSPTGVVKTVNSHAPSSGNVNVSKSDVGLGDVVNTGDSATPVSGGTTKFTTGGAYTELAKKAPNNHASSSTTYGVASASNYGHVKGEPLACVSLGSASAYTISKPGFYWQFIVTPGVSSDITITIENANILKVFTIDSGSNFKDRTPYDSTTVPTQTFTVSQQCLIIALPRDNTAGINLGYVFAKTV